MRLTDSATRTVSIHTTRLPRPASRYRKTSAANSATTIAIRTATTTIFMAARTCLATVQCNVNVSPRSMDTPALAPRRRFRPALVPTLAAIAAIALFVAAGNWQRDRMEQKLALRAQFDAAMAAPPVALPDRATGAAGATGRSSRPACSTPRGRS